MTGLWLRNCFIWLYFLGLTGCAYYGDIHGNSHLITTDTLSTQHVYKSPSSNLIACANWWNKFNDPQLNQLITTSLNDSPSMQIAESRIRLAQHLAEQTQSTLWPSMDMSGYLQRQRFSESGLVPPPYNGQIFTISELGLNLNYELDLWGKNREMLKAMVSEQSAALADFAQAKLVLSATVANTYFQLYNNIEQVKIAHSKWQLRKEMLQIALDRAKYGINSAIPIKTLQADTEAEKQLLQQYQQLELLSRHQLAALMGKNPFTTEIETKEFKFNKDHISLPTYLPANLLAQRPDVYAAKLRTEVAASQIKVAKARFFPDINLSALFSYQKVGFSHLFDSENQNNAITAAIDLPIFDAGERRANLGAKYAEYDIAVNKYNQTILNALQEIANQLTTLDSINQRLISQRNSLQSTQDNYNLFVSRYHAGIADYSELLEHKSLLLQQQATEIDLHTQYLQSVIALIKALGGHDG